MKRLALTLLLLGLVSAQAQTYLPRSELTKPLSPKVEKFLADFVDRCAVEKQKQLTTHMADVMKTVDLILRGVPPRPEIRVRTGEGRVEIGRVRGHARARRHHQREVAALGNADVLAD